MPWHLKPIAKELMAGTLKTGLEAIDTETEPYIPEDVKALIDELPIPEDLKNMVLPLTERGVSSPVGGLAMLAIGMVAGVALGIAEPMSRAASMKLDRLIQTYRLPPEVLIRLWRRGLLEEVGLDEEFDDAKELGISKTRLEALKRATEVIPTPQDAVSFLAHEVFEPEVIEKYGLGEEWAEVDKTIFAEIGISEELAYYYWVNHWQHPSFTQMVELRRRELVTDDDIYEWFRLVEIPPHWRPFLMELMWEVPTRVDIRRFWDMETIDEPRLRELYGKHGYHDQDLEDYVLWTKVYVALPDLIARYKNGWITEEDVVIELVNKGMSEERALELMQTKVKAPAQADRMQGTRLLTRALIIKGAKLGHIDQAQTIERLMGLNYGRDEAEFIYLVEVEESESPETPLEFRKLTDAFRRAAGVEVHEATEAALQAERGVLDLKARLDEARQKEAPQAEIYTLEAQLEIAEARFKELLEKSEE